MQKRENNCSEMSVSLAIVSPSDICSHNRGRLHLFDPPLFYEVWSVRSLPKPTKLSVMFSFTAVAISLCLSKNGKMQLSSIDELITVRLFFNWSYPSFFFRGSGFNISLDSPFFFNIVYKNWATYYTNIYNNINVLVARCFALLPVAGFLIKNVAIITSRELGIFAG